MDMRTRILTKLATALDPIALDVSDDSHLHAGHAGNPNGGGETHFSIKVVSQAFAGKSRLQMHRAINGLLADELSAGVHALAIDARAPSR